MKSNFHLLISFILIFCLSITISLAQSISVIVKNPAGETLPGAVVQLIKLKDSSSVSNITNQMGVLHLDVKPNIPYRIKISYLGFATLQDTLRATTDHQKFEYHLHENAITIGEATITAQRPLIRQEDDKMIIDPVPLINTSSNTLEVLEKTPGLYVDQDGSIYLSSTMAATIQINGNELKMSNEDIATLLRSLPPGSVQQIEVLRTPSTKYDASSSGGIINIVLKKGVKIGRTGSVSIGMSQGFYGNRFAGFNISNGGGKVTSYVNLNYNHNEVREQIHSVRTLSLDTLLHQASTSHQQSEQGYIGYGISFDAGKHVNMTYDGRLNGSLPKASALSNSNINGIDELLLGQYDNTTSSNSKLLNIQQDIGIVRKFDTIGSNLDTKFSYSFNNNNVSQNYLSSYSFPFTFERKGDGTNKQQRHYGVFQSDLTYQFAHKWKLEAGIKSTYQDYSSQSNYFLDQNGTSVVDTIRTNAFNYQESINAAYAQASKTFGKWFTLKAGVRMEHTYMSGHQSIPADTSFLINRVDFFPYVYLTRDLPKILGIKLSAYLIYRRTITRPDYQNLNPYIKFVDELLYETGNPALRPQFTDNYEINISFDDMPVLAFGQNYTKDIFSSVVYSDKTQNKIAIRTFDNLGKNTESYFRLMIGIPPGKKYFFALGAQYNYSNYKGIYENQDFTFKRGSWRLFTFHSLNLFKQTKITLMAFMMVNGNQNFYVLENFGQVSMGISQTLFKKKLTITINARDIFHTMLTKFSLQQGQINTYGDRYQDNQRIGINIRYAFGMKKKDDRNGFTEPEGEY